MCVCVYVCMCACVCGKYLTAVCVVRLSAHKRFFYFFTHIVGLDIQLHIACFHIPNSNTAIRRPAGGEFDVVLSPVLIHLAIILTVFLYYIQWIDYYINTIPCL